jgi:hypothetical protein
MFHGIRFFCGVAKNRLATMAAAEMISNLVLSLSVRWLPAMDALAATCVNTDWNAELSSEENNVVVWKQVSQNTNALVTGI